LSTDRGLTWSKPWKATDPDGKPLGRGESSLVRLSGGRRLEFFQNIESIHEETRVEPGPIAPIRPAGVYYAGKSPDTWRVPGRLRVIPLSWFYEGEDRLKKNPSLQGVFKGY